MSAVQNIKRRPQVNGPAQRGLTPALVLRAFHLQRANPDWSRRKVGEELSRQIGRWPPFTGAAIAKRLIPLEKVERT